jgi:DNA-binding MarR family transcriptional regulator
MTTVQPTSESAGSAGDDVGIALYRVLVRLSRLLRSNTPVGELTLTQLSTLAVVEASGSTRLGDLAAQIGVAAPSLSRMIESLCERGLVARTADSRDHRATHLVLSPSGKAALAEVRERGTGYLVSRIGALDLDQLCALAVALPALEQLGMNDVAVASLIATGNSLVGDSMTTDATGRSAVRSAGAQPKGTAR